MNELDDVLARRLAAIFALDLEIYAHANPPESVDDLPAALVMEFSGDMSKAGYRGLHEATMTARVLLLAALRGREGLPIAMGRTRALVGRAVSLLWTHDELAATTGDDPIAEITQVQWREAKIEYAGVDFSGAEITVQMRVDWQMVYGSGPVGTAPP